MKRPLLVSLAPALRFIKNSRAYAAAEFLRRSPVPGSGLVIGHAAEDRATRYEDEACRRPEAES